MRQLNNLFLSFISGAGTVTCPTLFPGERLIGWEQNVLYYEENTYEDSYIDYGLFQDTVYVTRTVTRTPIYQITPIIVSYI